jgi:hypothetical protein
MSDTQTVVKNSTGNQPSLRSARFTELRAPTHEVKNWMMQTVRIPRGRLNMFCQMTFRLDIRPFLD